MHSTHNLALVLCLLATRHSVSDSNIYSDALCLARFFCRRLVPWLSSSMASITSVNIGSFLNLSLSSAISGVVVSVVLKMSCVNPVLASQSSDTVYSLPSSPSLSVPSLALLSPSVTTFSFGVSYVYYLVSENTIPPTSVGGT